MGLESANSVTAPGNSSNGETEEDTEELGDEEKTRYRAIAARCNYLAIDRPDLQYAAKEACRKMSCPSKGDMAGLKKIGRDLLGRMRVVYTFEWQAMPGGITCYTERRCYPIWQPSH